MIPIPRSRREQAADRHRRRRAAALVTPHAIKAPATLTIGTLAAMAVIGLAALSAVLSVVAAHGTCSDASVETAPGGAAKRGIPANYLSLYRQAGAATGVPWSVLAAIGSIETDHGRSRTRPACAAVFNRHGCCAGPMQFNITRRAALDVGALRHRQPTTTAGKDIYDPEDAIPSAAAYLSELWRAAPTATSSQAVLGYNHSPAYVREVLARAREYAREGRSATGRRRDR